MRDYITSERFIHNELLRRAEKGLPAVKEAWRKKMKVDPFFISWPAEHIKCDDGTTVTDFFLLELPEDRAEWRRLMIQAIDKTKSYAVLLAEQLENSVLVIFESNHGTRSWRYPIRSHGNTRILGEPKVANDLDSVGLLWTARSNEA